MPRPRRAAAKRASRSVGNSRVSAVARRHDELAGNAIGMAKLDGGKEDSDVGSLRLRQNGIRPRIVKQELFDVLHPDGPVHAHPR